MSFKNIILASDAAIETWIEEYVSSDDVQLENVTHEMRVANALTDYYKAKNITETIKEKRDLKLMMMTLGESDHNLVKWFIESHDVLRESTLDLRGKFSTFKNNMYKGDIVLGKEGTVVALAPFGAVKTGETYTGLWRKASWPNQLKLDLDRVLPRATSHPIIFFDQITKNLEIPKQFKLL